MVRMAILAITVAFGVSGQAAANMMPPNSTEAEATEVVLAFLENFNAGSVEGILSTYSDSPAFLWVENGHIAYRSKAEAGVGMSEAMTSMKGAQMKTSLSEMRVVATGPETMFAYVPLTVSMPASAGLGKVTSASVTTMTLVRENGEWRILTGHTAADPVP